MFFSKTGKLRASSWHIHYDYLFSSLIQTTCYWSAASNKNEEVSDAVRLNLAEVMSDSKYGAQ